MQLLLHSLISGGSSRAGRGSQRRVRSRSILYTTFESSSLTRVSCFLILLWVLKAIVGLFGKSLESSGDFSMEGLLPGFQKRAGIFISDFGR